MKVIRNPISLSYAPKGDRHAELVFSLIVG
jgi:hypothetical protein